MMNRAKSLLIGLLSGSVWLFSGCAVLDGAKTAEVKSDPQTIVAGRADARWKALIGGNLDAAYAFLSPATRQVVSFEIYRARLKPGMWREAKVVSVTCDAELCKANVLLKYDLHNIKGLEMSMEESWLKDEGSWWYVPKK